MRVRLPSVCTARDGLVLDLLGHSELSDPFGRQALRKYVLHGEWKGLEGRLFLVSEGFFEAFQNHATLLSAAVVVERSAPYGRSHFVVIGPVLAFAGELCADRRVRSAPRHRGEP